MRHLLNTGEVALELGVTRARVAQLAERDTFPRPVAYTMFGEREVRLWDVDDIVQWDRVTDRSPGKPTNRTR